jgi:hypothetical protein
VGPRAGLDAAEKKKFLTLPGLELQLLVRPVSGHSLYRLHYLSCNWSLCRKYLWNIFKMACMIIILTAMKSL